MANIHTPERLQGESRPAYKDRRAESNRINKANRQIGQGGVSSRKQFRDSMRSSGAMRKRIRAYVALMAAWAAKRITKAELRDEHGAYTLTGRPYELIDVHPTSRECVLGGAVDPDGGFDYTVQRKWLAGISAQRGY
jgi:hypothetical protein